MSYSYVKSPINQYEYQHEHQYEYQYEHQYENQYENQCEYACCLVGSSEVCQGFLG